MKFGFSWPSEFRGKDVCPFRTDNAHNDGDDNGHRSMDDSVDLIYIYIYKGSNSMTGICTRIRFPP